MQLLSAGTYCDQKQGRTLDLCFAHLQLIPTTVLLGYGLSTHTVLSNHNASSPSSLQVSSHAWDCATAYCTTHYGAVTWKSTGHLCLDPCQVILHSGCCLLDTGTGQFLQAQRAPHGSLAWCFQVITVKSLNSGPVFPRVSSLAS